MVYMMGKNPAFQFYPSDWQRDMIEHPLEVEGFWIRICCLLWWSPTRGSATKPANIWANIAAISPQKCRLLFAYLLKHNIADIEIDNDVYKVTSRRMVRDDYIRKIRSEAGSLGGNPNIKGYPKDKNLVKQNTDKPEGYLVKLNPTPSSSSSTTKIKYTPDFLSFWSAYPNKKDKVDAFKAWQKTNGARPVLAVLLMAIQTQAQWRATAKPGEFRPEWKHPSTWLNKGSWADEIEIKANDPFKD